MKYFRLHHGGSTVELPEGDFIVGRSPECQLAIDDPSVSRKHARFRYDGEKASVEDLGSANGIKVNGQRIARAHPIAHGDNVAIGNVTFRISTRSRSSSALEVDTIMAAARPAQKESLVIGIETALAAGQIDQATLLLTRYLARLTRAFEQGNERERLAPASALAMRAARVTDNGAWIDWIFEAHRVSQSVIAVEMVNELHDLVRRVRPTPIASLRSYLQDLQARATSLAKAERFAVQRLEGLLRVAAAS